MNHHANIPLIQAVAAELRDMLGDDRVIAVNVRNKGFACAYDGCDRPAMARGLCSNCYARARRNGTVAPIVKQPPKGTGEAFLRSLKPRVRCTPWPFGVGVNGYGVILFGGVQTTASRASCIIHNGPPPTDAHEAAHTCGNGNNGCVNPAHLWWATPKENAAEKVAHGTHPAGENHPLARLTADDVREIRSAYGRVPSGKLAEKYGIIRSHLWAIANRKAWRSVP